MNDEQPRSRRVGRPTRRSQEESPVVETPAVEETEQVSFVPPPQMTARIYIENNKWIEHRGTKEELNKIIDDAFKNGVTRESSGQIRRFPASMIKDATIFPR